MARPRHVGLDLPGAFRDARVRAIPCAKVPLAGWSSPPKEVPVSLGSRRRRAPLALVPLFALVLATPVAAQDAADVRAVLDRRGRSGCRTHCPALQLRAARHDGRDSRLRPRPRRDAARRRPGGGQPDPEPLLQGDFRTGRAGGGQALRARRDHRRAHADAGGRADHRDHGELSGNVRRDHPTHCVRARRDDARRPGAEADRDARRRRAGRPDRAHPRSRHHRARQPGGNDRRDPGQRRAGARRTACSRSCRTRRSPCAPSPPRARRSRSTGTSRRRTRPVSGSSARPTARAGLPSRRSGRTTSPTSTPSDSRPRPSTTTGW